MTEEPFKDKNGNPLQRGLYLSIIDSSEITPNFVTGKYVVEEGERYILIENPRGKDIRVMGGYTEKFFIPVTESQLEAAKWMIEKSRGGVEDKTLELPLDQEEPERLFMGPE